MLRTGPPTLAAVFMTPDAASAMTAVGSVRAMYSAQRTTGVAVW